MIARIVNPLKTNSFFLFGARGTGKTTFVKDYLKDDAIVFDLLDDQVFDQFLRDTSYIEELCQQRKFSWIVIDEVQRLPKLLNLVHRMIEEYSQKFALTGSSSRKLKRGGGNLLAGRAFFNVLYPFNFLEIENSFELNEILHWGSLPLAKNLLLSEEKKAYLRSYVLTYIKEEVQVEQLVRNLEPFRDFLTISAQSASKIINYSNIARDVGVESPTVKKYFQILEDTYLGFMLPHFHRSVRKSQTNSPKFYYFDNGVKKALEGSLDSPPVTGTYQFGDLFESFIVQQIFALNQYFMKDFRLSFYRTKHNKEIDLILSKGKNDFLIEIKSTDTIDPIEIKALARTAEDFGSNVKTFYLSQSKQERLIEKVECLPWQIFLHNFKKL